MNVFIIATSHNIMQVREAIKYYKLDKKDVLLVYMHFRNIKPALEFVPKDIRCETFNIWTIKELISSRHDYLTFVSFLNYIKEQDKICNLYSNFYTSDYVLVAASILKPKRIVVMDEGTASIGVALERRKKKHHILKYIIKSALYLRIVKIPHKIVFFSQYPLKVEEPDTLNQYMIEKEYNHILFDNSFAIILGQPLSEVGVVEEQYYMALMSKLHEKLSNNGNGRIEYYAHRREAPEKLKKLKELGWNVHKNQEPFEYVFPKLNPCPSRIYSFYSPILDTLSKKYTSIPDFFIIEIPKVQLLGKRDGVVSEVYKVFKKNPKLKFITL